MDQNMEVDPNRGYSAYAYDSASKETYSFGPIFKDKEFANRYAILQYVNNVITTHGKKEIVDEVVGPTDDKANLPIVYKDTQTRLSAQNDEKTRLNKMLAASIQNLFYSDKIDEYGTKTGSKPTKMLPSVYKEKNEEIKKRMNAKTVPEWKARLATEGNPKKKEQIKKIIESHAALDKFYTDLSRMTFNGAYTGSKYKPVENITTAKKLRDALKAANSRVTDLDKKKNEQESAMKSSNWYDRLHLENYGRFSVRGAWGVMTPKILLWSLLAALDDVGPSDVSWKNFLDAVTSIGDLNGNSVYWEMLVGYLICPGDVGYIYVGPAKNLEPRLRMENTAQPQTCATFPSTPGGRKEYAGKTRYPNLKDGNIRDDATQLMTHGYAVVPMYTNDMPTMDDLSADTDEFDDALKAIPDYKDGHVERALDNLKKVYNTDHPYSQRITPQVSLAPYGLVAAHSSVYTKHAARVRARADKAVRETVMNVARAMRPDTFGNGVDLYVRQLLGRYHVMSSEQATDRSGERVIADSPPIAFKHTEAVHGVVSFGEKVSIYGVYPESHLNADKKGGHPVVQVVVPPRHILLYVHGLKFSELDIMNIGGTNVFKYAQFADLSRTRMRLVWSISPMSKPDYDPKYKIPTHDRVIEVITARLDDYDMDDGYLPNDISGHLLPYSGKNSIVPPEKVGGYAAAAEMTRSGEMYKPLSGLVWYSIGQSFEGKTRNDSSVTSRTLGEFQAAYNAQFNTAAASRGKIGEEIKARIKKNRPMLFDTSDEYYKKDEHEKIKAKTRTLDRMDGYVRIKDRPQMVHVRANEPFDRYNPGEIFFDLSPFEYATLFPAIIGDDRKILLPQKV